MSLPRTSAESDIPIPASLQGEPGWGFAVGAGAAAPPVRASPMQGVTLDLAIPFFEVSDRVKAVMSRLLALGIFGALLGSQALHAQVTATAPQAEPAQYSQRWDFFGGAMYSHFNPSPSVQEHAINLLGGQGSATLWLHPSWGIEASVRRLSGDMSILPNSYNVPANAPMSEDLFLVGPSVRFYRAPRISLGMHYLIGAAYGDFSSGFPSGVQPQTLAIYNDKLALGAAIGGLADYNVTPRWGVRFIADWQPTHYGFIWQNEFAGSVGLVYKFGSLHQ